MPKFYMIFAQKYFSWTFGGTNPPVPPSPMPKADVAYPHLYCVGGMYSMRFCAKPYLLIDDISPLLHTSLNFMFMCYNFVVKI